MFSKDKLIGDLQTFSKKLGETPTSTQMDDFGPHGASTYERHFGSWNNAIQAADLETNVDMKIPREVLIVDLQKLASELDKTPSVSDMHNYGPRCYATYINNFGTWNDALQAAGLEINNEYSESKEQLIEDLQEFAKELDRTPRYNEMNNSGPWHTSTYERNFGTWNNALEESGLEINRLGGENLKGLGEEYYGEDYYQKRNEALERDNYQCRVCENDNYLNCHHIKPRRMFDDVNDSNTLDNLITLCVSCHGTFEGDWVESTVDEFAEKAKTQFS